MEKIIQEDSINEEAARAFLNDCYNGMNLLPNVPAKITPQIAAAVLNVSMPTIERMLQDRQIELTKKSLLKYIFDNMLCNRPISWDDKEESAEQKEIVEPKKQSDIPENKAGLFYQDEPSLFSEEDLKQEKL